MHRCHTNQLHRLAWRSNTALDVDTSTSGSLTIRIQHRCHTSIQAAWRSNTAQMSYKYTGSLTIKFSVTRHRIFSHLLFSLLFPPSLPCVLQGMVWKVGRLDPNAQRILPLLLPYSCLPAPAMLACQHNKSVLNVSQHLPCLPVT